MTKTGYHHAKLKKKKKEEEEEGKETAAENLHYHPQLMATKTYMTIVFIHDFLFSWESEIRFSCIYKELYVCMYVCMYVCIYMLSLIHI